MINEWRDLFKSQCEDGSPSQGDTEPTDESELESDDNYLIETIRSPRMRFVFLTLSESVKKTFERIKTEYIQRDKLTGCGVSHSRKLLIIGPSGSGKTTTAAALAGELNLPLIRVRLENFSDDADSQLRRLSKIIDRSRGVYSFDDVGSSVPYDFLSILSSDHPEVFIVVTTSIYKAISRSFVRRFDEVIYYDFPTLDQTENVIRNSLSCLKLNAVQWNASIAAANGLSFAEVAKACVDVKKAVALSGSEANVPEVLRESLQNMAARVSRVDTGWRTVGGER